MGDGLLRNAKVAVGTTSQLLSAQKERIELIITNTGATNLTLSFGEDAEDQKGAYLPPLQSYFASVSGGFKPTSAELYIISDAINGQASVFERVVG